MIIKKVAQVGNPIIRSVAKRVASIKSAKTRKVVKNLVDSMRSHDLVGMAAPQIAIGLRIFVSEIRETRARKGLKPDAIKVYINPRIVFKSKQVEKGWEGCGSIANGNLFGLVERPKSVTVKAYNEKGELFSLEASGLLSRIIQHENDHLDGKLFTDIVDLKSLMSREEYIKIRK